MPEKAAELDRKLTACLEEVGAKLPTVNADFAPSQPSSEAQREGGRRNRGERRRR